jgi:acyl-CoA thioester hydrolase
MFSDNFQVRFYETDALAHVSNTVLVGWFESGREPIFKIFTPELNLQKWPLILASYQVDFLKQIFYGQAVEIRTFISRLGGSSFDVYQECWQNDMLCAKGTTTMVNFDYDTSKSMVINQDIRQELTKHLLE